MNQIGRHLREPIASAFRPTVFDNDVLALDEACFLQALAEGCHEVRGVSERGVPQETNNRHRRLLPSRALHLGREQQAAATEQCDELTPLHVRHGDFLPYALLAPPTGPCAQSSAPPACRRAALKSLGQT